METILMWLAISAGVALLAFVALVAFLLALAHSIPWWVLIAYFAMKSAERTARAVAAVPRMTYVALADARMRSY